MTRGSTSRNDTRSRIIGVASRLLQEQGSAAVTTRRVAAEAGVKAPAIYRLFGDKDGMLEAVAEHVMATHVTAKTADVQAASADDVDPLDDLCAGWRAQIDFGIANPSIFRLLSDPGRLLHSPSAQAGRRVLEARVHRVALAGRLRVTEHRAVGLIQAAGTGVIQTLLSSPPEERDPGLADSIQDAVLRQILNDTPEPSRSGPTAAAVALRALAPQLDVLSEAEQRLLIEWLDRILTSRLGPQRPASDPVQ